MTNAIYITPTIANEIITITSAGKTAWCTVNKSDGNFISVFANRDLARQNKNKDETVGKSTDFHFEVRKAQSVEVTETEKAPKVVTEVTHESTIERPCKKVWEIADNMKGQKRGVVLAACVDAGIAYFTARTQYQQWLQIQKEIAERELAQKSK